MANVTGRCPGNRNSWQSHLVRRTNRKQTGNDPFVERSLERKHWESIIAQFASTQKWNRKQAQAVEWNRAAVGIEMGIADYRRVRSEWNPLGGNHLRPG